MKKILIYASFIGIAAGAVYLLCKKGKSNNDVFKFDNNEVDFNSNTINKEPFCESNVMEGMYQGKLESALAVHERHSQATEFMADAFKDIFSDIEPVKLDEETEDIVIDNESVAVLKEIDFISDELDDLLNMV